jgi:hypothetical protein
MGRVGPRRVCEWSKICKTLVKVWSVLPLQEPVISHSTERILEANGDVVIRDESGEHKARSITLNIQDGRAIRSIGNVDVSRPFRSFRDFEHLTEMLCQPEINGSTSARLGWFNPYDKAQLISLIVSRDLPTAGSGHIDAGQHCSFV